MAQDDYRTHSMLFDYGSTTRTDFRPYELKAPIVTRFKEKPKPPRKVKDPLRYLQTLTDWKTLGIPFDVFHEPRPINGENPHLKQKPYFHPKDVGLQHAIETRPRLIMTPAVSLDDIKDRKARDILIDDIYLTDTGKAMRETTKPYFRVQAPFPELAAPANPITLPRLVPPVVPLEWRMESIKWDARQLRAYCDPTKTFWMSREKPKCRPCDEANHARALAKKKCQMEQERQLANMSKG